METIITIAQIIIALGILNVWFVRHRRPSPWRGGDAESMKEEFQEYGLPIWFMKLINVLKVAFALLLLAGVWIPGITKPAAIGMAILMIGAVIMHFKINDPVRKAAPASSLLLLCAIVAIA